MLGADPPVHPRCAMSSVSICHGRQRTATTGTGIQKDGRFNASQSQVRTIATGGIIARAHPFPFVRTASEKKMPNQRLSCHLLRSR